MSASVTAIILTKDEAGQLPSCLESLKWCESIHVVDSGSTDDTVRAAKTAGAFVWHNPFRSFGDQRNWALDHCTPLGEWVLFLDADERSTPRFASTVKQAVAGASPDAAGFYCCWKLIMGGQWLKWSDGFPRWQFRILRTGRARFEDAGHGQREFDVRGNIERISEPYIHEAFAKGWHDWFEKHNRYSSLEANERKRIKPGDAWKMLHSKSHTLRISGMKSLASRVPCWPMLRFLHAYILRGGFLDGLPGYTYAVNMAMYEHMIRLKIREEKVHWGAV